MAQKKIVGNFSQWLDQNTSSNNLCFPLIDSSVLSLLPIIQGLPSLLSIVERLLDNLYREAWDRHQQRTVKIITADSKD